MKHTIAQNKQLFNVKDIAYATTVENLAEGQFGIFAEGTTTSIPATVVDFAGLPENFRLFSRLGGKIYNSFDTINKNMISRVGVKDYVASQTNEWETTITHCDCITGFQVKVNIDEQTLIQRDGLTWKHSDFVVGVAAEEIDCQCKDGVLSGYDNNIITKLAVNKINALESPFYEAEARTTAGAVIPDLDAFIATNEAVNKNAAEGDDVLMVLVIKSKPQDGLIYRDLEVNYVSPRGARIQPIIHLNNGDKTIKFQETQALGFEIGAGYDLRAEEFECMSQYTDLNHYPQLHDGIASANLVYQFENSTDYDTVTFEFYTDKVNKNDGDKRSFGVLLGAESGTDAATKIKALFS